MAHHDEEEDDVEETENPGIMARLATVVVFVLLCVAVYSYLNSDKKAANQSDLPLITEEHPPEKVKPDNPGGMEIPQQDASVYDHLEKNAPTTPEKLMPSAEAPVATVAPATSTAPTTPPSTPATLPDSLASATTAPAPTPVAPAEKQARPPVVSSQNDAAELAKIVQSAAAPTPAPAPGAPTADARIQLGAVSNPDAAKAEWTRLQGKYGDDALKGLQSHFSEVNLGDKGDFVRIQTEALTQADAEARCQKLKLANQACIVIKAGQ